MICGLQFSGDEQPYCYCFNITLTELNFIIKSISVQLHSVTNRLTSLKQFICCTVHVLVGAGRTWLKHVGRIKVVVHCSVLCTLLVCVVELSAVYTKEQNWQCIVASGPKVTQTNVTACILSLIDMAKDNMEVQCDSASLSPPSVLKLTKGFTKG